VRARLRYLALAVGTIALGLAVHKGGGALPASVRDVLGDMLWAAMLVWWAGVLAPRRGLRVRAGGALVLSYAIELSQLYHSPAVDAVRRTTLGHLVLGSDFDARDLVAYALGVAAAAAIDRVLRRGGEGGTGEGQSARTPDS
jgi:hypothetical protein